MAEEEERKEPKYEYKLPDDRVSGVTPCDYLKEIYGEEVIYFQEMANRVPDFIRAVQYSEVPPFNGIPITESSTMFVNSFDLLRRDNLKNPPANIVEYAHYITNCFPEKACFPIASSWPPCIPRIANTIEPITAAMIKMVSDANDPTNLLRFISTYVFPKNWSNKGTNKNKVLYALSPCKYRKKEGYWAYIVRDTKEFFLVFQEKNGSITTKAQGVATKCSKSKDKLNVIVKGDSGRIADFSPLNPDDVSLWTHLDLSGNEDDSIDDDDDDFGSPFVKFAIAKGYDYYPDVAYGALYDLILANDGSIVRALIDMDQVPYAVAESLLKLTLHSRKVHLVFGHIVARMLAGDDNFNPTKLYNGDNFYRKFIHALFREFCEEYVTKFLRRIILTIDAAGKLTEKLFFTVVKYITMSSQFIPFAVRHFASVLREYASMKFNSKGLIYILLGGYFGLDFICPVLANFPTYLPDLKVRNPKLVIDVSVLLQFVFHGALLPGEYSAWNKRYVKHMLPKVEEFIFSIGDINGDVPLYPVPNQGTVITSVETIMNQIYKQPDVVMNNYEDTISRNITIEPSIGMNFAVAIDNFFRQYYDRGEKRTGKSKVRKVDPNPLSMPKLPMYGKVTSKRAGLNLAGTSYAPSQMSSIIDSSSFKERNISSLEPRSTAISMPLKPRGSIRNPINKPIESSDDEESSLTDRRPKPEKKDLIEAGFRPPQAPPKKRKRVIPSYEVSATEPYSITEDPTDDDPEMNRGKNEPIYVSADPSEQSHPRRRRVKVEKKNVLLECSDPNGDVIREEKIKTKQGNIYLRTIRSSPRGGKGDF